MKRRITYIVIIIGLGMSISSCRKDFLDITNQNELNSENFFKKISDFDLALNGVYDAAKGIDLYGQNFYVQTLLSLPHEADYWNAQCRNDVLSSDANVHIAWRSLYRIVARANDILENAPKFVTNQNPNPAVKSQLDAVVAQAHFLRGFAYFHLVRLWGMDSFASDPNALAVPVFLKVASTREEMMRPRSTVGEVYAQILIDFKAAEANLPASWDANNVARVSKPSVKAFLGQVHLYMEQYDVAKTYFEEVIQNQKYRLVDFARYNDLFQGRNEFSSESLWELNYSIDMQQNIWENGLGSGIALTCAPPGRGWSNCTPHGVNITRFGNDPRLKICTFAPTDLVATTDGVMEPAGRSEFNYTGHSFRKYVPEEYSVYSTNRTSGINFHMMRLADVYLMYAEVLNHLGDNDTAAEYMNKVRRRAYGFPPDGAQPDVDYVGLGSTQLRDSIREERFRELFAEGHRWYDICRWKIVDTEILKYNEFRVTQGPIIFDPKDYYYPIPLQELDNNTEMVQSTGY
jgi:tetratricopeptide (TPR) repeat protein